MIYDRGHFCVSFILEYIKLIFHTAANDVFSHIIAIFHKLPL